MATVTVFSGINYTNNMLELKPDIMDLPAEWIKKIVSIRVPKNMRIRLYDERKPSNSIEFNTDVPDLSVLRWANRAVRVNVEDISKIEESEKFSNCMSNNNSSLILILLMGVIIGISLSFLHKKYNN